MFVRKMTLREAVQILRKKLAMPSTPKVFGKTATEALEFVLAVVERYLADKLDDLVMVYGVYTLKLDKKRIRDEARKVLCN